MIRYFLARDSSCHWYVVEVAHRAEWEAWVDLPGDDERSWVEPAFAEPVNGSPSRVTFEAPVVG